MLPKTFFSLSFENSGADAYTAAGCFKDSAITASVLEPSDVGDSYRVLINAPLDARPEILKRLAKLGDLDTKLLWWNGSYHGHRHAPMPSSVEPVKGSA
jgi:hypothetical protein